LDFSELSEKLSALFLSRARRMKWSARFVRMVLLVVAAAVAGVAQFTQFEPSGPTAWQIAGICASIVVGIGALFSAITEEDASEALALARQSVEEVRSAEARLTFIDDIDDEFNRSIELYQVMSLCRGVIERALCTPGLSEEDIISRMLDASGRSAAIALNFAQADQWTVCVYRAEKPSNGGSELLRCIAQRRAIPCDTTHARVWEAGTGIAGVAFSNRGEVVIPDLQTTGLRSVFGTAANSAKPEDTERYRSMVAIPVLVDQQEDPWGVVTATNDRVDHFDSDAVMGIRPVETVRALANMVALAIVVHRKLIKVSEA